MSAYDPSHLPPPRDFGSTGMKTFNVEVSVHYREVLEVPATCPAHAEEVALQRLEDKIPVIFSDASVLVEVEK